MINIKKSQTPRASFKYNDADIREQIKRDFLDKCYLCEEFQPVHTEIDHFHPQKYFPDRVNDWENLFLCCQKCNKIKPKETNSEASTEILNNCINDVESLIKLKFNPKEKKVEIESLNGSTDSTTNLKLQNTINLLERIYNNSLSSIDKKVLIQQEISEFNEFIEFFEEETDERKKVKFSQKIQAHLENNSSFFTMKKWIVLDNEELRRKFANLIQA